jgi:hypothetical protein
MTCFIATAYWRSIHNLADLQPLTKPVSCYHIPERGTISVGLSEKPVCIIFKIGIRPDHVVNLEGMTMILFDPVYFRPLREQYTQLQRYRVSGKDQVRESSAFELSSVYLYLLTSFTVTHIDRRIMREGCLEKRPGPGSLFLPSTRDQPP